MIFDHNKHHILSCCADGSWLWQTDACWCERLSPHTMEFMSTFIVLQMRFLFLWSLFHHAMHRENIYVAGNCCLYVWCIQLYITVYTLFPSLVLCWNRKPLKCWYLNQIICNNSLFSILFWMKYDDCYSMETHYFLLRCPGLSELWKSCNTLVTIWSDLSFIIGEHPIVQVPVFYGFCFFFCNLQNLWVISAYLMETVLAESRKVNPHFVSQFDLKCL